MLELIGQIIINMESSLNPEFAQEKVKDWTVGITENAKEAALKFNKKTGWNIIDCSTNLIARFVLEDLKRKGVKCEPGNGSFLYCYKS